MSYRFILTNDFSRNRAISAIVAAPDGYVVTVEEPRRTNEQNDKMWSLLGEIAIAKPGGRKLLPHQWKSLFMDAMERETKNTNYGTRWEPSLDGDGVVNLGYKSSKLRKTEMSELLAYIEAWAAENGVFTEKEAA